MIRIVNLRNYKLNKGELLVKVDRSNAILGNKFFMSNESQRELVCNQYQEWLDKQICFGNEVVLAELRRIFCLARKQDIALGCWCYPLRCHSMTIMNFLNKWL